MPVLAAASLLAALGLSACGSNPAAAKTLVQSARAATLELADGGSKPATDGMTVPKGATLRTQPGGSAALVAAGRTVLLGSATAVTVVDGAREQLRAGLVLVDARRSPGLALDAGAATVTTRRGSLARVERGTLLRAASYRSDLTVRATGRRSEEKVPALHQVQVPDGGLPGPPTTLRLTPHDSWERSYALDLVTADADLVALAEGLDRNPASSAAVLSAVPASYTTSVPDDPAEPRSETALAYVLAQAGDVEGGDGFADVRNRRREGGSWGVVAAIVGAKTSDVAAALDTVLNPTEGPAVLAAAEGPAPVPSDVVGPGGTPSTSVAAPTRGPSRRPSPRPSPSPSRSSDPVDDVVTTVTGLLPTPTPVAVPLLSSPSPAPLLGVDVGGLGLHVG